MTQNVSWGVIISTRSLVLQRVGRYHSGMYACSAANDRGETQSSLVSLRIHCKYNLVHKYQIPMKAFHIHQNKNSNVQSKNNQNLFVKIIVMLNEGYFSISQFIFLSFSLSLSLSYTGAYSFTINNNDRNSFFLLLLFFGRTFIFLLNINVI